MNSFFLAIYLVSACLLVGGAFGLMYANIRSINMQMDKKPEPHPEAPKPGDEVMYVDVSSYTASEFQDAKDKLEDLYSD
jgi:hypothetical protein